MTAVGRFVRSRSPLLGKPLCRAMLLALSTLRFILCKGMIFLSIYKVN